VVMFTAFRSDSQSWSVSINTMFVSYIMILTEYQCPAFKSDSQSWSVSINTMFVSYIMILTEYQCPARSDRLKSSPRGQC